MDEIDWQVYRRRTGTMDTRPYLRRYLQVADPTPTMHPGYLLWQVGDLVRVLLFSELFYQSLVVYRGCLFARHVGLFDAARADRLLDEEGVGRGEAEARLNEFDLSAQFVSSLGWNRQGGELAGRLVVELAGAWERWLEYLCLDVSIRVEMLEGDGAEASPPEGVTFQVEAREGLPADGGFSSDWEVAALHRAVPAPYRREESKLGPLVGEYLYQVGDLPQMALYSELWCPATAADGEHPLAALYPTGRDIEERATIDRGYRQGPVADASQSVPDGRGVCVESLFQSDIGDAPDLRRMLARRLESAWTAWLESGHVGCRQVASNGEGPRFVVQVDDSG